MTLVLLDNAPDGLRGELCRWFLEVKPGVFVGNMNRRVRELLWKRICEDAQCVGGVLIFTARTEQGFQMELMGDPQRRVTDFEGVQLITRSINREPHQPNTTAETPRDFYPCDQSDFEMLLAYVEQNCDEISV